MQKGPIAPSTIHPRIEISKKCILNTTFKYWGIDFEKIWLFDCLLHAEMIVTYIEVNASSEKRNNVTSVQMQQTKNKKN